VLGKIKKKDKARRLHFFQQQKMINLIKRDLENGFSVFLMNAN
jgi:hypothetical protein